ncbi:uncharacterized protein LOC118190259 [Stegodyphus dumicola]|uniref:uncharacterized protein LOC118190259 n=1 Tax=Stegodyphus dumicola TaxID=202533 RepID=UPI0015A8A7F9|nr:uncharacterized protein LOC118190259 [Stegodyphus dumicola]
MSPAQLMDGTSAELNAIPPMDDLQNFSNDILTTAITDTPKTKITQDKDHSRLPRQDEPIRCAQINLQRAQAAASQLVQHVITHNLDLLLIQEPYCKDRRVASLPTAWKIFQSQAGTNDQAPRAVIACCNPSWFPLVITLKRDYIAILLVYNNIQIIAASVYSSPTEDISNAIVNIQETKEKYPFTPLLLGGDFNAHNSIWGYADTTMKGKELEDFLAIQDLQLLNAPNAPPSYDSTYGKGWPDLTISTSSIASFIQNWTILDEESASDHKYIHFQVDCDTSITILRRFKLPSNKIRPITHTFTRLLREEEKYIYNFTSPDGMEHYTNHLIEILHEACKNHLPIRVAKKIQVVSWWTKELRQQRQKCRALRRRLRATINEEEKTHLLMTYRKERAAYKKNIITAKVTSWRTFCTNNNNPYGILHKISSNKIFNPAQIHAQPTMDSTTNIVQSTASTILDTVFSNDDPEEDTIEQRKVRNNTTIPATPPDVPFTYSLAIKKSNSCSVTFLGKKRQDLTA